MSNEECDALLRSLVPEDGWGDVGEEWLPLRTARCQPNTHSKPADAEPVLQGPDETPESGLQCRYLNGSVRLAWRSIVHARCRFIQGLGWSCRPQHCPGMAIGAESKKLELAEAQTTSGIRGISSPPLDPETVFAEIAAVGGQALRSARSSAGPAITAGRLTPGCRSASCPAAGVTRRGKIRTQTTQLQSRLRANAAGAGSTASSVNNHLWHDIGLRHHQKPHETGKGNRVPEHEAQD
jgi:hypothetical protein